MELQELYEIFKRHAVVTTDTRHCPEGSIFFALKGATFDGNQFANQALAAGCAYAVVDDAEVAAADTRCLWVEDVLTTLQQLAHHHRRQLGTPIVQITGTNGKTTTAYMVESILCALGRKPGLIGTVEIRLAGMSVPARLTTPMPDELQSYLAFHRSGGGTDVVMETSSHALVQGRSDPVTFTVAGFF